LNGDSRCVSRTCRIYLAFCRGNAHLNGAGAMAIAGTAAEQTAAKANGRPVPEVTRVTRVIYRKYVERD
jgi:hypothetical protein